jgi:hypothetical protein
MAAQPHLAVRQRSTPETLKLRNSVQTMDRLSQEGLAEISANAKLALSILGILDEDQKFGAVAIILKVIRETACEVENDLNCQAEEVGCNFSVGAGHSFIGSWRTSRKSVEV